MANRSKPSNHKGRLRSRGKTPGQAAPGGSAISGFDLWLQRCSLISQVVLLFITLATLYYTVIPLYQKALLDEQLAKEELELAHTKEKADATYRQMRIYVLSRFVYGAGAECSGLMLPPSSLAGGESAGKEAMSVKTALDIDPIRCLDELAKAPALHDLSEIDLQFFLKTLKNLGENLEKERSRARAKWLTSRNEPGDPSAPLDSNTERLLVVLGARESDAWLEGVRAKASRDRKLAAIVDSYSEKVRSEVLRLANIKWPETE